MVAAAAERESAAEVADPAGRAASARLLAQLYRDNIGKLRSYLAGLLKSEADADDVAQEAFLRLHRRGDLSSYDNPRAVLFKTAYRLALNSVRAKRSSAIDHAAASFEDNVAHTSAAEPTAEESLIAHEQEVAYSNALQSLPPRCREVIELRTVQELSFKEMSDTLGLSISTLEKHVVRGKRMCAEALADWWAAAA